VKKKKEEVKRVPLADLNGLESVHGAKINRAFSQESTASLR